MLPWLEIKQPYDLFWKLSPRKVALFFEAERKYNERRAREYDEFAWLTGIYVKKAIQSSILVATLAEKDTPNKMDKYPEKPYQCKEEIREKELTDEQKKYETMRALQKMISLGGDASNVRFRNQQ